VWGVSREFTIFRYIFPIKDLSKFSRVVLKKLTEEEKLVDFHVVQKPGGHYVFEQRLTFVSISSVEGSK